MPARGRSLHVGLNFVDPRRYGGWDGELEACEFDARDMEDLALGRDISASVLLTRQATRSRVLAGVAAAAKALRAGDFFLLTYSGHGAQVPDVSNEEADGMDETWCLWDGELIDDEIYRALAAFRAGVRVVVLSDSCHSGTVVRAPRPRASQPRGRPRALPQLAARRAYLARQRFYDAIPRGASPADITASVLLISGCQDDQLSMDGPDNGAFTAALLEVWDGGRFEGTYQDLHVAIRAELPRTQSPNLMLMGAAAPALARQQPFRV
jgi:hypothetical protein